MHGTQEIIERIDSLIGCDDFKKLAHEIISITPQILAHGTHKTFLFQNYLFSVDDGFGLDECLELFAQLIESLGLFTFCGNRRINHYDIKPTKDKDIQTYYSGIVDLIRVPAEKKELVCIDISDCMNAVNTPEFRRFLLNINKYEERYVFVFRVPYIEREVLRKMHNCLNDVLFVKDVIFEPLNAREIRQHAERETSSLGYTVQRGAWEIFDLRIAEEKSDGRFYGASTVKKVVNEMLYLKQLHNAERNSFDSTVRRRDISALVRHEVNRLTAVQELDALCGMDDVRRQLLEIVSQIEFSLSGGGVERPCIHMRFVGGPGTGKTTVARILGKLLKERGLLKNGAFYEYSGRDLCGMYVGHTAPKCMAMCRDAYGSVMFIDEAYTLCRAGDNADFGEEALATLISEMENHRNDFVVIMAGYRDEMDNLMALNPGLAGRMPFTITFPSFSRSGLADIFMSMVKGGIVCGEGLEQEVRRFFDCLPSEVISSKHFGNARFVRNLFERTWGKASLRCGAGSGSTLTLTAADFLLAASACDFGALSTKSPIGFASHE